MRINGLLQAIGLFGLIINPAFGDGTVTRFHDKNGNDRGYVRQEGSRAVMHDNNGNERGYSTQEGNRTVYHDNNGNTLGYSITK